MTTGAPGGRTAKRQTDGEEERGGVRDTRAGKLAVDKELGGNLGGGREGGTRTISGREKVAHNYKEGTESSDLVAAILVLEPQ